MESKEEALIRRVQKSNKGAHLYISPLDGMRKSTLLLMTAAAVCKTSKGVRFCDCTDCRSARAFEHPEVHWVTHKMFSVLMPQIYSYPTPVVVFEDLDKLHLSQQMQLLIWLEMYQNTHTILMAAEILSFVLPTIQSRSFVTQSTPQWTPDPETLEQADAVLKRLFKGELRVDETIAPEDGTALTAAMRFLIQDELEGRLRKPATRSYSSNELELQTLMKILSRYLEAPKVHNLPLLLRSYQMLALQNIR